MMQIIKSWPPRTAAIVLLCSLPFTVPVALMMFLALWGGVGYLARFAAAGWGF